jgi:glutaredoxin-like protein
MIPPRDQDYLRQRFATELTNRVRLDLFTQRPSPIIVPGRQECVYCDDVRALLMELAGLSGRIALTLHDFDAEKTLAAELGVDKVPATVLRGTVNRPLRLFGFPSGTLFPALVEVMLDAARGGVALEPDAQRQLRRLKTDVRLRVLVTTTCPHSPLLLRTAARLALQSVRVKLDVIEVAEFPELGRRHAVRAVPTVLIGEDLRLEGVIDEAVLAQQILRAAEGKPAGEVPPGPATPIDPAMFQPQPAQAGPVTTSSGLILPR